MAVPDKIYLERILCSDEVYDNWKSQKTISDDIEYVRKDTFVEKAIKYIANHFLAPGMDNEIKDFENYIKEE